MWDSAESTEIAEKAPTCKHYIIHSVYASAQNYDSAQNHIAPSPIYRANKFFYLLSGLKIQPHGSLPHFLALRLWRGGSMRRPPLLFEYPSYAIYSALYEDLNS